MSSSGVLISQFRELPVWRYEIVGTAVQTIGDHVSFLRRYPKSELAVLKMPHHAVNEAIQWIDSIPKIDDLHAWQTPGRSVWDHDAWKDSEVRVSSRAGNLR